MNVAETIANFFVPLAEPNRLADGIAAGRASSPPPGGDSIQLGTGEPVTPHNRPLRRSKSTRHLRARLSYEERRAVKLDDSGKQLYALAEAAAVEHIGRAREQAQSDAFGQAWALGYSALHLLHDAHLEASPALNALIIESEERFAADFGSPVARAREHVRLAEIPIYEPGTSEETAFLARRARRIHYQRAAGLLLSHMAMLPGDSASPEHALMLQTLGQAYHGLGFDIRPEQRAEEQAPTTGDDFVFTAPAAKVTEPLPPVWWKTSGQEKPAAQAKRAPLTIRIEDEFVF